MQWQSKLVKGNATLGTAHVTEILAIAEQITGGMQADLEDDDPGKLHLTCHIKLTEFHAPVAAAAVPAAAVRVT